MYATSSRPPATPVLGMANKINEITSMKPIKRYVSGPIPMEVAWANAISCPEILRYALHTKSSPNTIVITHPDVFNIFCDIVFSFLLSQTSGKMIYFCYLLHKGYRLQKGYYAYQGVMSTVDARHPGHAGRSGRKMETGVNH